MAATRRQVRDQERSTGLLPKKVLSVRTRLKDCASNRPFCASIRDLMGWTAERVMALNRGPPEQSKTLKAAVICAAAEACGYSPALGNRTTKALIRPYE